jgi:transcription factor C subunit 6
MIDLVRSVNHNLIICIITNRSFVIDRLFKQYLAVAPFPSNTFSPGIGYKVPRPTKACIQIWSLGPSQLRVVDQDGVTGHEDQAIRAPSQDTGTMRCEIVLCIDAGPAHDLRWCPLPSHDAVSADLTVAYSRNRSCVTR